MFSTEKYATNIHVYLDNGLYIFTNYSATGKSYLSELCYKYGAYGEPIGRFSYEQFANGDSLEEITKRRPYRLFVVDRYDMYVGEGRDALLKLAKDCIVLVDLKQYVPDFPGRVCTISYNKEGILVE